MGVITLLVAFGGLNPHCQWGLPVMSNNLLSSVVSLYYKDFMIGKLELAQRLHPAGCGHSD